MEPATRALTETHHLPLALNSLSSAPIAGEPMALRDVSFWAYQIQDLDRAGDVDKTAV